MNNTDLTIVGGGISGLAAAHFARELGFRVRLIEAEQRLGGCISTRSLNGCLLEGGPDSMLVHKPEVLQLCKQLGIGDDTLPACSHGNSVMIQKHGVLHPLPEGFRQLAPTRLLPFLATGLLSTWGKLRACMEPLVPRSGREDQTLGDFVRRRLGREVLEWMAQPLVAGIYAADPDHLSLKATFPLFLELEKKYGSIIVGMIRMVGFDGLRHFLGLAGSTPTVSPFLTLRGGMGELVEALTRNLDDWETGLAVQQIRPLENGWELETTRGARSTSNLLLALPAGPTARLLAPIDQPLAAQVGSILCRNTATLNLIWPTSAVSSLPATAGIVFPLRESRLTSACTFSHQKFPLRAPDGLAVMRVHLGGAGRERELEHRDEHLLVRVLDELRPILGLKGAPLHHSLVRHNGKMPEYGPRHVERTARLQTRLDAHRGLALAGNWLYGVGMADCVKTARRAVERLARPKAVEATTPSESVRRP